MERGNERGENPKGMLMITVCRFGNVIMEPPTNKMAKSL